MALSQHDIARRIWRYPTDFLACGCGIGLLPVMPGTYASLAGLALAVALSALPWPIYSGIYIVLFLLGIFLCGQANKHFGTDDHPAAVWDEIAAYGWVLLGTPHTWPYLLTGFVLFRFFDIVKPGPIGWIDKNMHGGLGVMLDDIAAALASTACLCAWHFKLQSWVFSLLIH